MRPSTKQKPSQVPRAPAGAQTVNQKAAGLFAAVLRHYGLPMPCPELAFAEGLGRKWRWDYAWVEARLALEVQGGIWSQGRHGRGSGIAKDHAKFNAGAALGWRLLLVEPQDLATPATALLIRRALAWPAIPAPPPLGQPNATPLRVASRSTVRAPDRSTAPDTTTP